MPISSDVTRAPTPPAASNTTLRGQAPAAKKEVTKPAQDQFEAAPIKAVKVPRPTTKGIVAQSAKGKEPAVVLTPIAVQQQQQASKSTQIAAPQKAAQKGQVAVEAPLMLECQAAPTEDNAQFSSVHMTAVTALATAMGQQLTTASLATFPQGVNELAYHSHNLKDPNWKALQDAKSTDVISFLKALEGDLRSNALNPDHALNSMQAGDLYHLVLASNGLMMKMNTLRKVRTQGRESPLQFNHTNCKRELRHTQKIVDLLQNTFIPVVNAMYCAKVRPEALQQAAAHHVPPPVA